MDRGWDSKVFEKNWKGLGLFWILWANFSFWASLWRFVRILLKNGCMEAQGECCGANERLKGVFIGFLYRWHAPYWVFDLKHALWVHFAHFLRFCHLGTIVLKCCKNVPFSSYWPLCKKLRSWSLSWSKTASYLKLGHEWLLDVLNCLGASRGACVHCFITWPLWLFSLGVI